MRSEQAISLQIHPNPTRHTANIRFYLPTPEQQVTITVLNINGQPIKTWQTAPLLAGWQEAIFENNHLPTGVYLLTLQGAEQMVTKKFFIVD